jgi:L-aminopeptidase/D-esterase-like protein
MARTGSLGGNGSGDIFLAFSTANAGAARGDDKGLAPIQALGNNYIDPILMTSAYATEEAIINSMVAAEDMIGYKGVSVKALPHRELREIMRQYNRDRNSKQLDDRYNLPRPVIYPQIYRLRRWKIQ